MPKKKSIPFALYYRPYSNGAMRVWRESWPDDQFQILSAETFARLEFFCRIFNISLIVAGEEDVDL